MVSNIQEVILMCDNARKIIFVVAGFMAPSGWGALCTVRGDGWKKVLIKSCNKLLHRGCFEMPHYELLVAFETVVVVDFRDRALFRE